MYRIVKLFLTAFIKKFLIEPIGLPKVLIKVAILIDTLVIWLTKFSEKNFIDVFVIKKLDSNLL